MVTPQILLPELPQSGGVFSTREAFGFGESTDSLRRMCREGTVVRLRRGYYVAGATYTAATDVERHLLHARAEVRGQGGDVALCGVSAAALHGFDVYDQDLSVVDLVRLDAGAAHRTPTVRHHRVLRPGEEQIEVVDGLPAISSAQAVWEVACRSSLEGGVVTADSALRADEDARESWAALWERFEHVPGSRRARFALRLARVGSESVGESVTRVQFFRHGIPEPELQHKLYDAYGRLVARTDFWWEHCRHVGEFDGLVKYGRLRREGETAEQAVTREKCREDAVRDQSCGMSRFVWSMVMPGTVRRTMGRLSHVLGRSRQLYVTGIEIPA